MKLYMHPISTTSRPVVMFCVDNDIEVEQVVVDLMTGEHHQSPFIELNPNRQVPVLDDDGFVLTESSAILKYLADKTDSSTYPKDLKARARVNEAMDWFNTNLYRELGYHSVYPQVYPHHARPTDELTSGTVSWGLEKVKDALGVLDSDWRVLASGSSYLTGAEMTIADYFGAELLLCGELIRVDLSAYPNVERWLDKMRALPNWDEIHEVHNGFAASLSEKDFATIG